jgi:type III pantothenate kinase
MNLIIDVGNTLLKLAVFDNQMLTDKRSCDKVDFISTLEELSIIHPRITDVIISSVGNFSEKEVLFIQKRYQTIILNHQTKVPFINQYKTPGTLGVDRIALVSSAAIQYPKENILIIDVGSCITYDLLNSKNEYLGGSISPGIDLRYKALHDYTNKLPLLKPKIIKKTIGNTTNSSIHTGVIQGVVNEIDGFITAYKLKHKDLTIILTGGGAHYLVDSLKNDIFANSNFLLEGLNYILQNNKTQC